MRTQVQVACPGRTIGARYEAVLNDGSIVPFSREYDEDNPPALHVVFLRRTSPDAYPEQNGNWDTVDDPLATAMTGFRLRAELRANPRLTAEATIAPEYGCFPNRYSYSGPGAAGGQGGPITLLVTEDDRYLAGLVQPISGGGIGGGGGAGGEGGAGGAGGRGTVVNGQRCANGPDGADGQGGQDGPEGPPGPAPRIATVEAADIFPRFIPQPLQDLIDYSRENW